MQSSNSLHFSFVNCLPWRYKTYMYMMYVYKQLDYYSPGPLIGWYLGQVGGQTERTHTSSVRSKLLLLPHLNSTEARRQTQNVNTHWLHSKSLMHGKVRSWKNVLATCVMQLMIMGSYGWKGNTIHSQSFRFANLHAKVHSKLHKFHTMRNNIVCCQISTYPSWF